jgi:hypothetical protein
MIFWRYGSLVRLNGNNRSYNESEEIPKTDPEF